VWFVVALCVLIALTALVMCIPVDLGLRVEADGRPTVGFTLEWLFGRVKKHFRSDEGKEPTRSAKAAAKEEKKRRKEEEDRKSGKKGRPGRESASLVWRIVRTPRLFKSFGLLLRRLLKCFRLRQLYADFRLGLEDPADTALIVGTASQAAMLADLFSPHHLRVAPAFENDWFIEGEGALSFRVYPISLVPPVVLFFFSPSTLRVVGLLIRWKIRGR